MHNEDTPTRSATRLLACLWIDDATQLESHPNPGERVSIIVNDHRSGTSLGFGDLADLDAFIGRLTEIRYAEAQARLALQAAS